MSEFNQDMLGDMAIEALERTAFVSAEPADSEFLDELDQSEWYTRIKYSGPVSGAVYLAGSPGFMLGLASSLLGVEIEDVAIEKEGLDALRELTNIVGGSVVSALGGDHCKLSLGLPEVVEAGEFPSGGPGEHCVLDAEGERLEIFWQPAEGANAKAA